MTGFWVLNASPIICLASVGHLDLLQNLPAQTLVPVAVVNEIQAGPQNDPAKQAIASGKFSIKKSGLWLDDQVIRAALKKTTDEDW